VTVARLWRRGVAALNYELPPKTIEYQTYLPAKLLRDAGFDVHIVSRARPRGHHMVEGVTCWIEPSTSNVVRRLAQLRAEFVYCEATAYGVLFGKAGRRTWHRNPPLASHPASRALQRRAIRWFDAVTITNPAELNAWHLRPRQIVDLSYPVDLKFWRTATDRDPDFWSQRGLPVPRGPVIVCVAGLVRLKRQVELADALAPLLRARPDASLVFVGHPFDRAVHDELIARRAANGVADQVILTGALTHDGVRQVLAWSTVSVIHSEAETQCMAIYESLASGVPVIMSPIPQLQSQFPTLPAPTSDAELRDAVARLIDDPGAVDYQLGTTAERVEWADRDRHDQNFRETIERLLGRTVF